MADSALGPIKLSEAFVRHTDYDDVPEDEEADKTLGSALNPRCTVSSRSQPQVGRAQSVPFLNTRTTRGTKLTVVRFPEIDKGPVEPDLPFLLGCILVRARTDADVQPTRRPRRHDHRLGRDRLKSVVLTEARHLTDQRIDAKSGDNRVNRRSMEDRQESQGKLVFRETKTTTNRVISPGSRLNS